MKKQIQKALRFIAICGLNTACGQAIPPTAAIPARPIETAHNTVDTNVDEAPQTTTGSLPPNEDDEEEPTGDQPPSCTYAAWVDNDIDGCSKDSTWPVCSKTKGNTEQGLCDMAGNVWEWVEDVYHETYEGAPTDGSAWIDDSNYNLVTRGGGWSFCPAQSLRTYFRGRMSAAAGGGNIGFRCVRSTGTH